MVDGGGGTYLARQEHNPFALTAKYSCHTLFQSVTKGCDEISNGTYLHDASWGRFDRI